MEVLHFFACKKHIFDSASEEAHLQKAFFCHDRDSVSKTEICPYFIRFQRLITMFDEPIDTFLFTEFHADREFQYESLCFWGNPEIRRQRQGINTHHMRIMG